MNFIKKYYPMVISLIFVSTYSLIAGAVTINNFDESNVILLVPLILSLVGIWAEIIGFIIHVAKNKGPKNNVLWAFLIYFFNIFIIPYYNLKYVVKEKKITSKMIVFIILLLLSVYIFILSSNLL